MKQIDFKQNISVPKNDVRGIFEITVLSAEGGGLSAQLTTGGTIGSVIPSNLFNTDGSLLSLTITESRWYLCLEGTMNSQGQVTSSQLTIRASAPPPISVTPYIPPTTFCFPIYAGMGGSYVRLIGPSAALRTLLVFQEYEIKYSVAATNFINYYTLSFI